jgi:hypothetical protein
LNHSLQKWLQTTSAPSDDFPPENRKRPQESVLAPDFGFGPLFGHPSPAASARREKFPWAPNPGPHPLFPRKTLQKFY